MMPAPTVKIWDPIVRIGHWLLVIAFAVAYLTEDEALQAHVWAGYTIAAYIVVRVIWGLVGSPHARFSDFLFSPLKGLAYLADLVRMRAPRYLGHSPAGALMVFALLFALAGTVVTGVVELAQSRGEGPLSLIVEQGATPSAMDEAAGEREESAMMELHELFANVTLILIALHVAGVVLASVAHKESLVLAMINGRKRANPDKGRT